MRNFPKVMSNLGIGADDSQEAINILSDKLQGLPTSLDNAASAVQRFTSANSDIQKSTKYFLAVNNAILAGGASSEIQATALEQLSQAYAKGKPDMMEWRSMMTAMPAQLKQVATAMGYVSSDALGESLRDGTTSMDEFMETIERLNTQGVGDFASFEEQARNSTGGINTSITNMKTAFIRGVAGIVQSLDESLAPMGGISGLLSKIGKVGEKVFSKVGKAIKTIVPIIIKVVNFFDKYKLILTPLVGIITAIVAALNTYKAIMTVINTLQAIQNALLLANPAVLIIAAIVAAIAALIAIFMYLWNNCEAFRNFWINLWEGVKNVFQGFIDGFKKMINFVIDFVKENWGYMVGFLVNPFGTAFKLLYDKCEGFRNFIDKIVGAVKDAFHKAGEAIKKVFIAVKDTVTTIFSTIAEIIKTPINAIIESINKVLDKINEIEVPEWVPGIGGSHTNFGHIPKLDVGTNYVPKDMLAVIHKGESVVPKKFNPYANGISASTLGSMGNNKTIVINIQNNMEYDSLGQMVNKIKTFSGGSKNDFNYGMGR